jgi:hypothetical protein
MTAAAYRLDGLHHQPLHNITEGLNRACLKTGIYISLPQGNTDTTFTPDALVGAHAYRQIARKF